MSKFRLIVIFWISFCALNAQNAEWIYIEKQDTSLVGIRTFEIANGNLIVLGTEHNFVEGSTGIPFDGFFNYGPSTYLFDKNNEVYQMQLLPIFKGGYEQILAKENSLFIPFNFYIGFEECHHPFMGVNALSYDLGLYELKLHEDRIIAVDSTHYPHRDTAYCGILGLVHSSLCKDYIYTFRHWFNKDQALFIDKINSVTKELEETKIIPRIINPVEIFYHCENERIVIGGASEQAYDLNDYSFGYSLECRNLTGEIFWRKDSLSFFNLMIYDKNNDVYLLIEKNISNYDHNSDIRKIDKDGNLVFYKEYFEKFVDLIPFENYTLALENANFLQIIHLLNESGEVIRTVEFETERRVYGNSITITSNNDVIITGTIYDDFDGPSYCCFEEAGPNPIYLLKIPISDIITINEIDKSQIKLYPNPVNDFINIDIPYVKLDDIELTIDVYDLKGNLIISGQKIKNKFNTISLNEVPSGIYFINLYENSNLIKREKVIKV